MKTRKINPVRLVCQLTQAVLVPLVGVSAYLLSMVVEFKNRNLFSASDYIGLGNSMEAIFLAVIEYLVAVLIILRFSRKK